MVFLGLQVLGDSYSGHSPSQAILAMGTNLGSQLNCSPAETDPKPLVEEMPSGFALRIL